jgi:hypothetical protein
MGINATDFLLATAVYAISFGTLHLSTLDALGTVIFSMPMPERPGIQHTRLYGYEAQV